MRLWTVTRVAFSTLREIARQAMSGRLGGYYYLGNREALVKLRSGLHLFVDCNDVGISAQLTIYRKWEPGVEAVMRRYIKPGHTVLDVGAHIGYHTLNVASLIGPQGRVLAFEPQPKNQQLLEKSLFLNGFSARATILKMAVGRAEGSERIRVHHWLTGGGHMGYGSPDGDPTNDPNWAVYTVRVRRLDDVLREQKVEVVDFMKIDAEGSEYGILEGLGNYLKNPTLKIIMEWSPVQLSSRGEPRALLDKLRSLQFTISELTPDGQTNAKTDEELLQIDHCDLFLNRP